MVDVQVNGKATPLQKSYWNSFHCVTKLHQKGKKLTSQFCNNRWCMVCNRVRTAKLINGYLPQFDVMPIKYFVTLTIPNVDHSALQKAIERMIKDCIAIGRNIREKKKVSFKGIRKLECTFNADRFDYHPHLHLIVDSVYVGHQFIDQWLDRYPKATRSAQDVREADNSSVFELFKYFTKVVSKPNQKRQRIVYVRALDTIFRAMVGKRVFQPMGIKKISEEVDPTLSELYDITESDGDVWRWITTDWVSTETGELLTNYVPSDQLQELKISL